MARNLSERARAVVAATEQTPGDGQAVIFALQDVVDGLAGIPQAACAGTALVSQASRAAMRDLAVEVRCLHASRVGRIAERLLARRSEAAEDLDETARGLAVASRTFSFATDADQAAATLELSRLVARWAESTRQGGRADLEGIGKLIRGFGSCAAHF